jgi:protein-S-isoprenylcysteine O-methyltransferase Ste14
VWLVGLLLAACALPLWVAARLQLGAAFSFRANAQMLVTHGLYARLRHPIYVFGCLAYLGSLLALQIWPILVLWLALTPLELVRAIREERVLEQTFGDDYRRYRVSTWF